MLIKYFRNKEEPSIEYIYNHHSHVMQTPKKRNSFFRTNYLVDSMYVSRDVPVIKSTSIHGIPVDGVTSLLGDLAKTRPTPPTLCTVLIAVVVNLW